MRHRGPRVLLTDAEERSVLACARGLAAAGFRVAAAAGYRPAVTHWSRACGERLTLPDCRVDLDGFAAGLRAALGSGFDVLVPGSEQSLTAVSGMRSWIEPEARIGLAPHEAVLRAINKEALASFAAAAGLPTPETVECATEDDVRGAVAELGYPVVMKPVRTAAGTTAVPRKALVAPNAEVLAALLPEFGPPVLLQRYRDAPVVSVGGVCADGRLLGVAASRYRRTWFPDGGSASFTESIRADRSLVERVEALAAAARVQGIFEVELLELGDGRYAAIDLNPRVYGSMALALRAGANLPAVWAARWLLGERPAWCEARPGVHYRWEDADLRHLIWHLRRGHGRATLAVLRPRFGTAHAYFGLTDPGPLAARLLELTWMALQHERGHRPEARPAELPVRREAV
jgi:predicted ATP-grasp superfamily ATP-dependent carboligase